MYSPTATKVFIKLYEDAQEKLASVYKVHLPKQPAEHKEEHQDASTSQR